MISCVGVAPGQKNQLDGNGAVNERIADAAKKAKVGRLVYISVASAISEGTGKLLFADYVKGKAQAEAARQRAEQALLVYEATLQESFREVEDSLVAVRTYRDEHAAQSRRAHSATQAAKLSRARYNGGVVDYLEVLDTERTLFNAELDKSQSLQRYYNAIVRLYAALGGGWSVES